MQELPFECRPIQEGSSLLIRGFPSGAKPYEEVLTFLRKGTMLQKYGRHGNPKYHYFRLGAEDTQLQWESKNGRIRYVQLLRMRHFQRGQETDVFRRRPQPLKAFLSFSILYLDEKRNERSLDVICLNHGDFEMWYWGIQVVRSYPPSQFYAFMAQRNIVEEPKKPFIPPQIQVDVTRSQETITSSNLSRSSSPNTAITNPPSSGPDSAHMAPLPKTTRAPSSQAAGPQSAGPVRNSTGTIVLGSANGGIPRKASFAATGSGGAAAVAKPGTAHSGKAPWWDFPSALNMGTGLIGKREIGDLYVWGSLAQAEQTDDHVSGLGQHPDPGPCISVDPMREWQQTPVPELVHDTGSVDVVLSACGMRHAALVSRAGELYTWGYGKDGNLGHGSLKSLSSPRRVLGGWVPKGEGVRGLSCSDGCTAAVTSDGSLYTWGRGLSGQLGHGDCYPCAIPKRVMFGPFLNCAPVARVVRVSVGPTHTAAITADGRLYTWGDGQFGQLGHGSTCPEYHPRQVEALEGMFVTAVACGWWHTAAIAYGCPEADGNEGLRSGSNPQVATWIAEEEGEEVQDLAKGLQQQQQPPPPQQQQGHSHPLPSPFVQQGVNEPQVQGSMDSQHQDSPGSAERGVEEDADLGAAISAEGGVDGAQGGEKMRKRKAGLAQINVGGLSDKGRDSSKPVGVSARKGGLSSKASKESRSPSRSPREGPWGSNNSLLPSKRTVSFQDEVCDVQRCSHSHSAASSPRLVPTASRESPLRHSSELFVWKEDAQKDGSGLQQGAGRRRSGDSAGSFEGHGHNHHLNGPRQSGGVGARERQLQQHQNHQQGQYQHQQQPPTVMADALQGGLFSEASSSLLLSTNDDVEHAHHVHRSSAPSHASASLSRKSVAGRASLSGNLTGAHGLVFPKMSAPPVQNFSRPSAPHLSSSNSIMGGGAAGVHGAGVLFTWGGLYGWVEPKDVREAVAQTQPQQQQQQQSEQERQTGVSDVERPSDGPPASCFSLVGNDDSKRSSPQQLLDTLAWASAPPSPSIGIKHDHHGGCLGTGDKEGRLLPTRVCGELEGQEVAQVACGLNLTVAVTRSGKVYQMGTTGAQSEQAKKAAWEGCTSPTLVDANLRSLFVEQVACGMHHVAVIASPLTWQGKLLEERRRSRLLTWGRGTAGQLGHEHAKDCSFPQDVAAVEGRRIMHVASGGNHTFAICEHNPLDHARRTTQHHHDKLSQQPLVTPRVSLATTQPALSTTSSKPPPLQKSLSSRKTSALSPMAPLASSQQILSSLPSALQSLGHPNNALSTSVPALHLQASFGSRAAHQAATASGALGSLLAQSLGLSSDKSDKAGGIGTNGGGSALERPQQGSTPSGRPPTGMLHSMGVAAVSAVAAVTPFRDSWGGGNLDARLKEKLAAKEKRSTHAGVLNEGHSSKVVVGIPSQEHPTLTGCQAAEFKASLRHSRQHRRLSRMRSHSRATASSARLAMARSQSHRHTTSGGTLFGDHDSPMLKHRASLSRGQQQQQLKGQQPKLPMQRSLTTGSKSEGSADLEEDTVVGAAHWKRGPRKTSSRLGISNSAFEKASERSDDEGFQVTSRMQSAHEPQLVALDSDPLPAKAWSTEAEALDTALLRPEHTEVSNAQSRGQTATQHAVPPANLIVPGALGPQHSESDSLSGYTSSPLTSPVTPSTSHAQLFRIGRQSRPTARPTSAPPKTASEQQKQLQQQQQHPHKQQQQQQLPTESLLQSALGQQHRHQQQRQQHSRPSVEPASPAFPNPSGRASGEQHREPPPAQPTQPHQQVQQQAVPPLPGNKHSVHPTLGLQEHGHAAHELQGSQLHAPDGSAHLFFDNSHHTFDDDNDDSQPSLPNFTILQPPSLLDNSSSGTAQRPGLRARPSENDELPSFEAGGARSSSFMLSGLPSIQVPMNEHSRARLLDSSPSLPNPKSSSPPPITPTRTSSSQTPHGLHAHPHPQPQLQSPIAKRGMHGRHHTRSATLANWAELTILPVSPQHAPVHSSSLSRREPPPSASADDTSLAPIAPERGPQPTHLAWGDRVESARWYDNHAAVSDGEESNWVSPVEGMSPRAHNEAGGLMVTNPLSLNPLKLPSGPNSDADIRTAQNSSYSTPNRIASGELPCDTGLGPGSGGAHAAAGALQQHKQQEEQEQQQQQDHGNVLLQGQASRVSLSPSITEVSLQPRSNVHRYGEASEEATSSPATTTSNPHTNSLPGSSVCSHSLRNSQSPSASSTSPFAQSMDATPTSLFAPRVAHQAAHAAAALHAQPPTPPRIFDLSSLGATATAHGHDSHSRSMSAGGVRVSSPPAASDHRPPDPSANALDHMSRANSGAYHTPHVEGGIHHTPGAESGACYSGPYLTPLAESGAKSRGGSPFQPLLTASGLEEAGGGYAQGSPSPSSQPLLTASSGRRMVGVPSFLSGPRAHSRSRSLSVTPPPPSREPSMQKPHPPLLASRGGSLRQRLSFSAEDGNSQSNSQTHQCPVQTETPRSPRSPRSNSIKHRLGLTADERTSSSPLQQSSYSGGEGAVVQGLEGGVGAHRGQTGSRGAVEETTSPTASRRQLDLQRGKQQQPFTQQQRQRHGQQEREPLLQQPNQLEHQSSRRSLESLPSGSHQRIQLLQQPSRRNTSGSDSGSQLQEGDFSNHPFASTFSVELLQPSASDLHGANSVTHTASASGDPGQYSTHTAAQCEQQLDTTATDSAGAQVTQGQPPLLQQQEGRVDTDIVSPGYNPIPASPFHAWGLSPAAAGALTSPAPEEVSLQQPQQLLQQRVSGTKDSGGVSVGSKGNEDSEGAGSVVFGESSERELWGWARDSPAGNTDIGLHHGSSSSLCVGDAAQEEESQQLQPRASPAPPSLPVASRKRGAVTAPQTPLSRGHSDAAFVLRGTAAASPPPHVTHHYPTPLYPPSASVPQPMHADTTHSNISSNPESNTAGAGTAQKPVTAPAAPSPFDVAGVVQAVGPAMLRTKAGSMLARAHRRTRSTEVHSMEAMGALALTPAPSMPQRAHNRLPSMQHLLPQQQLQQQQQPFSQQQQQQQQTGAAKTPLGANPHLRSYNSASLSSPSFSNISQPSTPAASSAPSLPRPPLPPTTTSNPPTSLQAPSAAAATSAQPSALSSSPAKGHPAHSSPPAPPHTPPPPLQLPLPPASPLSPPTHHSPVNPSSPPSIGTTQEHASSPSLGFPPAQPIKEGESVPEDLLAAPSQPPAVPPASKGGGQAPSARPASTSTLKQPSAGVGAAASGGTSSGDAPSQAAVPALPPGSWVEEPEPGVYLMLRSAPVHSQAGARAAPSSVRPQLYKVRFSKKLFGEGSSAAWWTANRPELRQQFEIDSSLAAKLAW